jgi:flagellar basal body rod protein FlgF
VRRSLSIILLALALPAIAATQSGTTTRPAELRATPVADGKLLKALPANAKVDVLKRTGGWYQVKTAEGTEGWVRMWLVRFSAASGAFGRDSVAVLGSGRSGSTYTTATTGVRGLSEEELQNAKPNPAAVAALERLAVAPDDARTFAKQGSLKASVEPKEAP